MGPTRSRPTRDPGADRDAAARREELRTLLRTDGILRAGPDVRITGRDGTPAPWMLYTPAVTLTARGAELTGDCVSALLEGYESTQLASIGYTGLPLVSACIARGRRDYTGLVIRDAPKAHGAGRQIDGVLDRARPVVVVDDSISSGRSLKTAIGVLEANGLTVEGAICLVRFPYRGGPEWAEALGYRVETVFDVWNDLEMPIPAFRPGHIRAMPSEWSTEAVADGLHPADAARAVAVHLLEHDAVLRPPASLDRAYDGAGGTYVSFRTRATDHRLARDGFWHFDPTAADPCRDVVLATVKTVRGAKGAIALDRLPDLKIGVSFLGALERTTPAGLDFSTYGIVARSLHWPTKIGGALPDTQVFISEAEQLHHARIRNARLGPTEPYELFRHRVAKFPEPGATWLPFGATTVEAEHWSRRDDIGALLVARVRAALEPTARGRGSQARGRANPLPADLIAAPVVAVAVTLYRHGALGCGVAWHHGDLSNTVERAAAYALRDDRFGGSVDRASGQALADVDIVVSVLHDREWLGTISR